MAADSVAPSSTSVAPDEPAEWSACSQPGCKDLLAAYRRLSGQYQRAAKSMATAAHDLNTPLSIVSGYIDLLQTGKLGPVEPRQKAVLDDMKASTARLKALVQDFLIFSGFESGRVVMKFDVGDINACINEICGFWLNRFQHRGIALYTLSGDPVAPFPFDYPRVQRIISNLLENSLRYAGTNGSVWVNVEPIFWERRALHVSTTVDRRKNTTAAPNAVRISVSDTGPGIPPEFHQEIFEDFFKGDPNGDGIGLGLAIARRLVQAHGGRIWVESPPGAGSGSGSTFSFMLPFSPPGHRRGSKPNGAGA